MQPEASSKYQKQSELFRNRLDQILDHKHPLYQISNKIDWEKFEKDFGKNYTEKTGRPGLRIRLLVGLHYLKHSYNVSDERVVEGYLENPYWQYLCGNEYFAHDLPCDPTSLVKWRKRIGSDGLGKLLEETILLGQREGQIKDQEFTR
ncbi:transposase, partial [Leptospira weilii]